MSAKSSFIIKFMHVLTWIAFLGMCVKAGAILVSFGITIFRTDIPAKNLYLGLDLSQLQSQGTVVYAGMVICIAGIAILQALLFYTLIRIFLKINFVHPFHPAVGKLITLMSGLSLIIGLFSKATMSYAGGFISQGLSFPHLTEHIGQGDAYLFFAGILFVIATVFKRGIELQTENELTV